ncbi:uncharacterized protein LOC116806513 [Drosophila grimshawi]|uniref:uncharacterized protein LOC116806513 n=1 Tax=Drosophila grimshawi TaxID=7222 RepID=UPI001C936CBD|nr:uncharacterized protein LOC116806513 [Drosophila grimshawi]
MCCLPIGDGKSFCDLFTETFREEIAFYILHFRLLHFCILSMSMSMSIFGSANFSCVYFLNFELECRTWQRLTVNCRHRRSNANAFGPQAANAWRPQAKVEATTTTTTVSSSNNINSNNNNSNLYSSNMLHS